MVNLSQRLPALPLREPSTVVVPFGEWLPDLPEFANPGALTARNVIPKKDSYGPAQGLVSQTNALDARVIGAFAANDATGNAFFYAGTATKLYEGVANVFTDQSKLGGYATAAGFRWNFDQFGQTVIATNFTDPVQFIGVGAGAATDFADLITSTNKPKARYVAVVGDFLVLGHTSDAVDGHVPHRVWWSAIGNSRNFDPSATTQSDFQDVAEGGRVQGLVGGIEYGIIFQERKISRMEYSGTPRIFDIRAVERGRGTPIPGSIASIGRMVFYISEEGFHQFDGTQSLPIGHGKVDRTFWNEFDIANKDAVWSAVDPVNSLVAWLYPTTGGIPDRMMVYNWIYGKWAQILIDAQLIVKAFTQGFTLEGLDAISTNIDLLPESLDSDAWKGGRLRFAAFDTLNRLSYFTGNNLQATIDTGEAQLARGRQARTVEIWPLVDGGPSVCAVGTRNRTADTVVFGASHNVNAKGFCEDMAEARYHRFRVTVNAGASWAHAQGVEVLAAARGRY